MTPLQLIVIETLYRVDSYLSVPAIARRASLPRTVPFHDVSVSCRELMPMGLVEETRHAPGKKKGTYGYRLSSSMREAMDRQMMCCDDAKASLAEEHRGEAVLHTLGCRNRCAVRVETIDPVGGYPCGLSKGHPRDVPHWIPAEYTRKPGA